MKHYVCIICGKTFSSIRPKINKCHNRKARELNKSDFSQHKKNIKEAKK